MIFFFRPPIIRVSDKVMIPQDEHPDINFVGLLIGPRGNTLKCNYSYCWIVTFVELKDKNNAVLSCMWCLNILI